jgi:internalin A
MNPITDLMSLAALTNLTDLTLNGNEITDLRPLAELKNLSGLGLGRNEITDVGPLSELKNLTGLELHHKYTRRGNYDLTPLAGLTKLEWLNLEFNFFITDDQKAMLRKALPNCNIIFD